MDAKQILVNKEARKQQNERERKNISDMVKIKALHFKLFIMNHMIIIFLCWGRKKNCQNKFLLNYEGKKLILILEKLIVQQNNSRFSGFRE